MAKVEIERQSDLKNRDKMVPIWAGKISKATLDRLNIYRLSKGWNKQTALKNMLEYYLLNATND